MKGWKYFLDHDFGVAEGDQFHILGYVYHAEEPAETPYREVEFSDCYIPLNKITDTHFRRCVEAECKQYITDLSEAAAEEAINWYVNNALSLSET